MAMVVGLLKANAATSSRLMLLLNPISVLRTSCTPLEITIFAWVFAAVRRYERRRLGFLLHFNDPRMEFN